LVHVPQGFHWGNSQYDFGRTVRFFLLCLITPAMNPSFNSHDPPVTVCVLRRVKPGYEAEFEEIITGICNAAMQFEGHLGVNIFRPYSPLPTPHSL
jgi:hypothetical protein